MAWLERLFNEQKFVRRCIVFWAMGLITFTVVKFFELYDKTEVAHATVIAAIIGILATAVGLYIKLRGEDIAP